jgi:peptidoglycan pentaglycine glycine transferase (the first glycine)
MQLQEILENEKKSYDNFVAAQQSGSFLQSYEWGGWQAALGRQTFRYLILNDIGEQVGSVQLIRMPLPFGKYYLYAPYGPVVNEELGIKNTELVQVVKNKFPDAIFIRIEPKSAISNQQSAIRKSQNIQPAKTLVINLSKTEDLLLSEMHHKTRYNIKVAQKHGVEIKDEFDISIGHGLFYEEALEMIVKTAARQKFNTFSPSYYKAMVDFFVLKNKTSSHREENSSGQSFEAFHRPNVALVKLRAKDDDLKNVGAVKLHVYKGIFQNELICAGIMIDFGKVRTYLFGGSSDVHKNVMAPYFMHWQAMLDAKKLGFDYYDFWGIETSSGDTPGFVRFKLGFGGEEKFYAGAYDVVQNKLFYKTYVLLRKINKVLKKTPK